MGTLQKHKGLCQLDVFITSRYRENLPSGLSKRPRNNLSRRVLVGDEFGQGCEQKGGGEQFFVVPMRKIYVPIQG